LLGYTEISRLARELEGHLMEKPLDSAQVRESLAGMALAFSTPHEACEQPIPEAIVKALGGKVVAVAGLPAGESQRLCAALERVDARPVFFKSDSRPAPGALDACSVAVVWAGPDPAASMWLDAAMFDARLPLVLAGEREHLLALDPAIQGMAREFLMDSWQPDEALVRLSLALSAGSSISFARPSGRPRVLIADDDPTMLSLVRMALENFGMTCEDASDGPSAMQAVRDHPPHAVVLDVNMPGMDGYEVLTAIRAENLPTRVLLLTARQQERDVIRGFSLGADDYVVKPFSPMELVARLKRLISR